MEDRTACPPVRQGAPVADPAGTPPDRERKDPDLKPQSLHPWNVPIDQARGIQEELAQRVDLENTVGDVRTVAAVDIAMESKTLGHAAAVLFAFPGFDVLETAVVRGPIKFPYVPGLLSFREGPLLIDALLRLRREPDVIFFDGQGVAHPRRLGVASHLGLVLDKATVGLAKSRLVGTFKEPGPDEGAASDLVFEGRLVGYAVRSRVNAEPIFVSPGHGIDYKTALRLATASFDGQRVPRPIRVADGLSKAAKRGKEKEFIAALKKGK